MNFSLNASTAVTNVDTEGNTATITFVGGRQYSYTVGNIEAFTNALNEVIDQDESVGSFINQSIRSEDFELQTAAWLSVTREPQGSFFCLSNTAQYIHIIHAVYNYITHSTMNDYEDNAALYAAIIEEDKVYSGLQRLELPVRDGRRQQRRRRERQREACYNKYHN